jgi:hypothetical protein
VWRFAPIYFPALTRWATVFRSSGAELHPVVALRIKVIHPELKESL